MNIVVLDGYALNPGDLSWDPIQKLAKSFLCHDRTSTDDIVKRSIDADIILTNKTPLSKLVLEQLPNLKMIGVLATGFNIVDIAFAKSRNITVCNVPAYSTPSVAQMVFAHVLNIFNNVGGHSIDAKQNWPTNPDFAYRISPQIELAGKTFGIFGLGNTGAATAQIATAFGLKVIAFTSKSQAELPGFIVKVSKEELFQQSDILSLHCPLTPETTGLVNKESLKLMKPSAVLINTGRGPLINDQDLADALNSGRLYAAGVDVITCEPPKEDNPLLKARNFHVTPHIAWATNEARARLMVIVEENIKGFIAG